LQHEQDDLNVLNHTCNLKNSEHFTGVYSLSYNCWYCKTSNKRPRRLLEHGLQKPRRLLETRRLLEIRRL